MGRERLEWLRKFVSTNGPGREILQLSKNDMLFEKGGVATHLYRVVTGQIKTLTIWSTGKSVTHEIHRPQQWVFEGPIDAQRNYMHSAIAMVDSSVLAFARSDFRTMLLQYPYLSITFGVELASQMDELHHVLDDQAMIPADRRLARALLAEIEAKGVHALRMETTPSKIAELIGRTRQTGHRVIDKFEELGILTVVKKSAGFGREKTYHVNKKALEDFLASHGERE